MKLLRMGHMLLRELTKGDLTLRAASLVFTTLLSLVPMLAVSFSLLKAFGVRGQLDLYLFRLLEPLGERGQELAVQVMAFVEKVNMGLLGGVGILILFVTVLSLVQKVEDALNSTWRVRKSRNFAQRFSGYLSVLLVGPLIMVTAIGLMGAIMATPLVQSLARVEPFGTVLAVLPSLIPYLVMIAGFSFIYRLDAEYPGAHIVGPGGGRGGRDPVGLRGLGIRRVRRQFSELELSGHLLELCDRLFLHAVGVHRVADPAHWWNGRLLSSACGVSGGHAR